MEPGRSFDLRYEFLDQNQPRAGSDKVAVGQVRKHHDEVQTINQNLVATYTHNFASDWGFSVVAPVVDRDHEHIHNHRGAQIDESWNFTRLGDVRVVGRYEFPLKDGSDNSYAAGINGGLKLPTGQFDVTNAKGAVAERSLQPGSGTTDGILGFYFHQQLLSAGADWFAQIQYQRAMNSRQDYRPGYRTSIDSGIRKGLTEGFSAQLQINLVWKGRDSGTEAEPNDSGGRFAFLSPGLSYAVSHATQIYGFVQLPAYQRVNGVQLTADWALMAGVTTRF
ncbi:MAG: hypothetical protein FIB06_01870 [Betaproteobacteria bacterium]|nr:hypothetical protein [Betaproteobacteria bacterium]